MIEFIMPTPMIEPIKVCELDAGRPKYQVPKFQTMAEISKANTMANPAAEPTLRTSSTGSRLITPNATAPFECRTPARLQRPDQMTATQGGKLCV